MTLSVWHCLSNLLITCIQYNAREAENISSAVMLTNKCLLNGRCVEIVNFSTMDVQ